MNPITYHAESFTRGVAFRLSRKLESRQPCDVWPGIESVAVSLRPFAGRFGNVSRYELSVLCAVARWSGARSLFEFGTFDGLTAWHLAHNCGPEALVHTLDLPLDHPARRSNGHDRSVGDIRGIRVGQAYQGTVEAAQIRQIYQDSLTFAPAELSGKIDFCFIDAGHEFEHVASDTRSALALVRPGGVIFWHDYSRWWPGVQRVLDSLSRHLPAFRVAETSLGCLVVPEKLGTHPTLPLLLKE